MTPTICSTERKQNRSKKEEEEDEEEEKRVVHISKKQHDAMVSYS
jgi:hypothetical protein